MNNHNEYLIRVESYLTDLEVTQRSKILIEANQEISQMELVELLPPLEFANEKRAEHGFIVYRAKKKVSLLSLFFKFSLIMLLIVVSSIGVLIWNFTPILKVDEENNRIVLLGGLIDIDGKAGKMKVFDDYHFSDDSFTNDFQASIALDNEKEEVILNFNSGSFHLKNSSDENFSLDCKLANPPTQDIISQKDDLVQIDFTKIDGLNCALSIPHDKKITIEGKQASIKVPSPEYNLYIELENGKVYLTPEQEIDYTYNLSIENKSPNNYIGDFKSSEADVSFEIRINLQSGAIIRK